MKYFTITFDDNDTHSAIARRYDLAGVNQSVVYTGETISEWCDDVTFWVEGDDLEDYLFCAIPGWIIVSQQVESIIQRFTTTIQFLPVHIIRDNKAISGYKLLQILDIVSALDIERTIWLTSQKDKVDYPQLNILKAVLSSEKIEGKHIFRLKEKLSQVYISEDVKMALEANRATSGFKFLNATVI